MSIGQIEAWRAIDGYPGYEVSSYGRVRSCRVAGTVMGKKRGPGHLGNRWRILKLTPAPSGHLMVRLSTSSGTRSTFSVHRLVLEAFVGPCPSGEECRHFPDRNPANNRLENLAWGTKDQQVWDKEVHGTILRGSQVAGAKLTEEKVKEIRERYQQGGISQKHLAKEFGVHVQVVWRVVHFHQWRHV